MKIKSIISFSFICALVFISGVATESSKDEKQFGEIEEFKSKVSWKLGAWTWPKYVVKGKGGKGGSKGGSGTGGNGGEGGAQGGGRKIRGGSDKESGLDARGGGGGENNKIGWGYLKNWEGYSGDISSKSEGNQGPS
ncbi:hypothetical protein MtrunA17_Chr2g0300931 [Medicago truncatula]|uniref:Nodule-specific Glycine Rich Peptide MtNodGRP2C n=1 Tax=Medicago truncatula TaxID=3880 RepID=A7KHI0_MEDTR|nr:glycine-rich protein DOT1 [Medicago truncatula]ABS31487.1 nodule-specific glycine-rich protein 2C [Medicago truncatula]AES65575.1 Nodule-specific Glycine Rich Peptide MtNodGRP2C [Medicago truncatula]RHN73661.1 hypothetical protein MtrunA17_Chr2g0300931 [Medicago truncatula]